MTHRLQGVTSRVDKEQTAVNTGVGDMSVSKSSKLLSKVGRVLILDLVISASRSISELHSCTHVFHDRIPAVLIVDHVSVARSINNVQP
jgi:hypothetical protein